MSDETFRVAPVELIMVEKDEYSIRSINRPETGLKSYGILALVENPSPAVFQDIKELGYDNVDVIRIKDKAFFAHSKTSTEEEKNGRKMPAIIDLRGFSNLKKLELVGGDFANTSFILPETNNFQGIQFWGCTLPAGIDMSKTYGNNISITADVVTPNQPPNIKFPEGTKEEDKAALIAYLSKQTEPFKLADAHKMSLMQQEKTRT